MKCQSPQKTKNCTNTEVKLLKNSDIWTANCCNLWQALMKWIISFFCLESNLWISVVVHTCANSGQWLLGTFALFTKRIAAITSTLQKKLEAAFQEGLQTGELNLLSRVLRTYAIIDKTRDAEMLFREVTVKPYMSEVRRCNVTLPLTL